MIRKRIPALDDVLVDEVVPVMRYLNIAISESFKAPGRTVERKSEEALLTSAAMPRMASFGDLSQYLSDVSDDENDVEILDDEDVHISDGGASTSLQPPPPPPMIDLEPELEDEDRRLKMAEPRELLEEGEIAEFEAILAQDPPPEPNFEEIKRKVFMLSPKRALKSGIAGVWKEKNVEAISFTAAATPAQKKPQPEASSSTLVQSREILVPARPEESIDEILATLSPPNPVTIVLITEVSQELNVANKKQGEEDVESEILIANEEKQDFSCSQPRVQEPQIQHFVNSEVSLSVEFRRREKFPNCDEVTVDLDQFCAVEETFKIGRGRESFMSETQREDFERLKINNVSRKRSHRGSEGSSSALKPSPKTAMKLSADEFIDSLFAPAADPSKAPSSLKTTVAEASISAEFRKRPVKKKAKAIVMHVYKEAVEGTFGDVAIALDLDLSRNQAEEAEKTLNGACMEVTEASLVAPEALSAVEPTDQPPVHSLREPYLEVTEASASAFEARIEVAPSAEEPTEQRSVESLKELSLKLTKASIAALEARIEAVLCADEVTAEGPRLEVTDRSSAVEQLPVDMSIVKEEDDEVQFFEAISPPPKRARALENRENSRKRKSPTISPPPPPPPLPSTPSNDGNSVIGAYCLPGTLTPATSTPSPNQNQVSEEAARRNQVYFNAMMSRSQAALKVPLVNTGYPRFFAPPPPTNFSVPPPNLPNFPTPPPSILTPQTSPTVSPMFYRAVPPDPSHSQRGFAGFQAIPAPCNPPPTSQQLPLPPHPQAGPYPPPMHPFFSFVTAAPPQGPPPFPHPYFYA
ncbi:hypothetical protein L596_028772 [Steinernema carpocapsae]|uniref:Uncharacterized protein n=1 Tax=Steinernema carpocapsae TaxID=34508 RepID=A0A4U5LZG3_STECR|nr:hypothetical protein L596_028772 [Steinernema carpocapsae]